MTARSAPSTAALARDVGRAARRIRAYVRRTPLDHAPEIDPRLWLKREDLQLSGSFKLRGALNAVLALAPAKRRRGVVAASTGNHGLAVTQALAITRTRGTIVVPRTIERTKRARLEAAGATLRFVGKDCVETELAARRLAERTLRPYVSPYNDARVVAGQGTVGSEIVAELPDVDVVFVAVGGGGLICGIAAAVKARRPRARIVGCLPQNSPFMSRSVAAGRILEPHELRSSPTLSDATAGGIEAGAITFPLCERLVDEFVEVDESEIRAALGSLLFRARTVAEGAAGVALAGWRRLRSRLRGKRCVVVVCGGNVDPSLVRSIARGPLPRE